MKELAFFKGYQRDENKRCEFNKLSVKIFDLSFEAWYQAGYWRDKYIPYTFFDGEKAVANISVNIMDFSIFGHQQRTIQLGTVMTDEAYRNQGLSRKLMEKVFADWKTDEGFIYLFANATVWDFYPKLGFTSAKQYQYQRKLIPSKQTKTVKLDMDKKENRDKLYDFAKNTCLFSKITMKENADLVIFYAITVYKDNVFFLPEFDAIAFIEIQNRQLHILDLFSKNELNLDDIILALGDNTIDSVWLGFVPMDCSSWETVRINEVEKDEMLFIESNKTALFDENRLMFPLLSHA